MLCKQSLAANILTKHNKWQNIILQTKQNLYLERDSTEVKTFEEV